MPSKKRGTRSRKHSATRMSIKTQGPEMEGELGSPGKRPLCGEAERRVTEGGRAQSQPQRLKPQSCAY